MHSVSVNRSSDINVVFTQNMDASTLTPANIKVNAKYSGVLPILINFSPENRSMRIDPQIEFKAGEKVYVTLTSGVQTAGDNPITPFTYSFIAAATGGSESFLISDSIDITGNVKAGDIDGDGDIDIAAGNGVNGIGILRIMVLATLKLRLKLSELLQLLSSKILMQMETWILHHRMKIISSSCF